MTGTGSRTGAINCSTNEAGTRSIVSGWQHRSCSAAGTPDFDSPQERTSAKMRGPGQRGDLFIYSGGRGRKCPRHFSRSDLIAMPSSIAEEIRRTTIVSADAAAQSVPANAGRKSFFRRSRAGKHRSSADPVARDRACFSRSLFQTSRTYAEMKRKTKGARMAHTLQEAPLCFNLFLP